MGTFESARFERSFGLFGTIALITLTATSCGGSSQNTKSNSGPSIENIYTGKTVPAPASFSPPANMMALCTAAEQVSFDLGVLKGEQTGIDSPMPNGPSLSAQESEFQIHESQLQTAVDGISNNPSATVNDGYLAGTWHSQTQGYIQQNDVADAADSWQEAVAQYC